jgi:hypothetical protein
MKEYHGPHKDHHYWLDVKPEPKPEPTKPIKTSKPLYHRYTTIENGRKISVSVRVAEPVRLDGYQI